MNEQQQVHEGKTENGQQQEPQPSRDASVRKIGAEVYAQPFRCLDCRGVFVCAAEDYPAPHGAVPAWEGVCDTCFRAADLKAAADEEEEGAMGDITFAECVAICASQRGLVEQFDRLRGTHLSTLDRRSPLDAAIDEASGRDAQAAEWFIEFVWDCVWTRGDWRLGMDA